MKDKFGFKYIASSLAVKAIVPVIMAGVHWYMMAMNFIIPNNMKFALLTVWAVVTVLPADLFMVW